MDSGPPGAGLVALFYRLQSAKMIQKNISCRKNGTERGGHRLMKVSQTHEMFYEHRCLYDVEAVAGHIEGLVFYNSLSIGSAQHLLFAIGNLWRVF